ncbi:hypothetical protein P9J64_13420 [Deltaproteobacteria bacterium IMCC39524]|nr:hypothetical protein [Deltaproteobacteria bacterium IMCC39524]
MKMLKVVLAALVMVAMVTPVIAEDRLSLNGEMRVRGWYVDTDNENDSTDTYGDQRLRIGGKIAVAEGVSITFRTDITESRWGSGNANGSGRTSVGGSNFQSQHWDRAHIDLTKGNFHLRAGQQFKAYGKTYAVDVQSNGLSFDIKGDVPVNVFAFLIDDNAQAAAPAFIIDQTTGAIVANPAASAGNSGLDTTDAFIFGAHVKPIKDVNVFVAGQTDYYAEGEEVFVIGASGSFDLGPLKLDAEADFFDGDATDTVDAFGTQLFLDLSGAVSDTFTVGGQLFYALGDDEDTQYSGIGTKFGGWDPIYDVGTSLSNENMRLNDNKGLSGPSPFDFSGKSAGVVGGRLYASMMLGDAKVAASAAWLEVEEDKFTEAEAQAFAIGLVYPVMENTTFQAQAQFTSVDDDLSNTDGDVTEFGTGLFVKF